mmetsp:Transcript_23422/g.59762  ORF Transcript_23422/g.59762 Transcript_23422/m.59762 type:complete len:94 (-) Transcript_23422:5-286(-)
MALHCEQIVSAHAAIVHTASTRYMRDARAKRNNLLNLPTEGLELELCSVETARSRTGLWSLCVVSVVLSTVLTDGIGHRVFCAYALCDAVHCG